MTTSYRVGVAQDQIDWAAEVVRQLSEAGFKAELLQGFPIVRGPLDMLEKARLIDFWPEVEPPVRKEIWEQGMLFLPNFG